MNAILERVARETGRHLSRHRRPADSGQDPRRLPATQGTRPDDPNDVVPHEHRRELRALRVFGAWTNLTDLKAANTLDALATENGRTVVKHYLQDVGSTFGMCNDLHEWDLSYEHFYQGDTTRQAAVLVRVRAEPVADGPATSSTRRSASSRAIASIRETWRPQTPTTAYMEMRDDDAFWAARRVAAFTDDLIRAAVHTGQFSDPAAEKYLGDVLIKRRDKIAQRLSDRREPDRRSAPRRERPPDVRERRRRGRRRARARRRTARRGCASTTRRARRSRCRRPTAQTTTIAAPAGLPTAPGSFVQVDISADSGGLPDMEAAGPHPLPPNGAGLEAGRARAVAGNGSGSADAAGRVANPR